LDFDGRGDWVGGGGGLFGRQKKKGDFVAEEQRIISLQRTRGTKKITKKKAPGIRGDTGRKKRESKLTFGNSSRCIAEKDQELPKRSSAANAKGGEVRVCNPWWK